MECHEVLNAEVSESNCERKLSLVTQSILPEKKSAIPVLFQADVWTDRWNFNTKGTGREENISESPYCLLVGWDHRQDAGCAPSLWTFGCITSQESQEEGSCQEVWTGCPAVASGTSYTAKLQCSEGEKSFVLSRGRENSELGTGCHTRGLFFVINS